MSPTNDLPTIWEAQPHTLAKHAILKKYLQAWMPIVAQQTAKLRTGVPYIRYIDGFAGPGEYKKGEPGSPMVALQAALEHSLRFPVPVRLLFVEADERRHSHLKTVLSHYRDKIAGSANVQVEQPRLGDCADVLSGLIDECEQEKRAFGPAFVFLDQFGYSSVPMKLIERVMAKPMCEVFSYLDWRDMNRFITDKTKSSAFTSTFGGEEWRDAVSISGNKRHAHLLRTYVTNLRERAGVKLFCYFSMHDHSGNLLYWLFFCSQNLRGLELMKQAMWRVDETGSFQFSDADAPGQMGLLKGYDSAWLAQTLRANLSGEALTVRDIKEYVLTKTPCHVYNEALKSLENAGEITTVNAPANRRKGTFRKYEKTSRMLVHFR